MKEINLQLEEGEQTSKQDKPKEIHTKTHHIQTS